MTETKPPRTQHPPGSATNTTEPTSWRRKASKVFKNLGYAAVLSAGIYCVKVIYDTYSTLQGQQSELSSLTKRVGDLEKQSGDLSKQAEDAICAFDAQARETFSNSCLARGGQLESSSLTCRQGSQIQIYKRPFPKLPAGCVREP